MKPIKGLTDNQNKLINNLINEFKTNNKKTIDVKTNIIDILSIEANKLAEKHKRFYAEIKENNDMIIFKRNVTQNLFYKKLIKLFKNHSDIKIVKDGRAIKFGYMKDEKNFSNNYVYISFNVLLETNEKHGISFYFEDNQKYLGVNKYCAVYVSIDKEQLDLSNFENSEIFKNKVFEMFEKRQISL